MKSNKQLIILALLIIVLVTPLYFLVNAQKSNYVFLDTNRVYTEFELTQELTNKLEETELVRKTVLDSLRYSISIAVKKIEKSGEKPALIEEYNNKLSEYQVREQQFREDAEAQSANYDAQIKTQFNQYIKEFGDKKGYQILLGATGTGNVMYGNVKYDVTEEALDFINDRYIGL